MDRADGEAAKAKLREEIVKLSETARVLSPETALLVLETEEDYARYGIDRKALADILVIEGGRASLTKRAEKSLVFPPREVEPDPVAPVRGGPAFPLPVVPSPVIQPLLVGEPESGPAFRMAADASGFGGGGGADRMEMDAAPETSGAAASVMAVEHAELEALVRSREVERRLETEEVRNMPQPSAPPRPHALPSPVRGQAPAAKAEPYQGKFKEAMALIAKGRTDQAAALARGWLEENPGELLAYVALGEALEAAQDFPGAARAYGSIIDLFPARADLRRFAGERLERLKEHGLALSVDTFRKARESRPDHPSSHRLYAFALLKQGHFQKAFDALAEGVARKYPEGRFRGVDRVLAEDLGLIAAAWGRAEPARLEEIRGRLKKAGGTAEDAPSLRFVLNWETDANDVDFHIMDGKGGHAFFSEPKLASGGELYADVTTGYGPECFTIRGGRAGRAYPYTLQAHYYSRGPMGFGMGKLQIVEHDGKGGLSFTERPFVIMADGAYMELGRVK